MTNADILNGLVAAISAGTLTAILIAVLPWVRSESR